MRTRTVTVREGELVGPIDWNHEYAKDRPQLWRDAEKDPRSYLLNDREVYAMGMYDGWPYWKPTPAFLVSSPVGGSEWTHFNSYGVHNSSLALSSQQREAL